MISLTSPIRTGAHDWPAGAKLAALCASTVALFQITSLPAHAVVLAGVMLLYLMPGRLFFLSGLSRLRMLWPFVVVVGAWHLLLGAAGDGMTIVLRMISAVGLANVVTMTTRLSDMIEVVHRLASPLRLLGFKSRALEIAIGLVIRMTPVLLGKGRTLVESWQARSRRRPGWRLILPFILLAVDDADHVAEALKARGGIGSSR